MKKVLALALALVLTMGMGTMAFAASKDAPSIGVSAGDYDVNRAPNGPAGGSAQWVEADGDAVITNADITAATEDWTLNIQFIRNDKMSDGVTNAAKKGDYKVSFKKDDGAKYFDVSWDSSAWKIKVVAKISYSWAKDDVYDYAFTAKFRANNTTIEVPVSGTIRVQNSTDDEKNGNIAEGNWYFKPDKDTEDMTVVFDKTDFEIEFTKLYDQSRVLLYYNTDQNKDIVRANLDADLDFVNFPGRPEFANAGTFKFQVDEDKYIYEIVDGKLVESSFRWNDEEGCWTMRGTRLGSYVVSDRELVAGATDASSGDGSSDGSSDGDGQVTNPGTGANDVVGVAAAMAVVSLVAAGAVAFKKASK